MNVEQPDAKHKAHSPRQRRTRIRMRIRTLIPRQHLRWKLAWSYTLVTLSAIVLAGSLLVLFLALTITPDRVANLLDVFIRETIPSLAPALASEPTDAETLDTWLQSLVFQNTIRSADAAEPAWRVDLTPAFIAEAAFVDQQGNIVAFEPAQACASLNAACFSYDVLARLDLLLTSPTADAQTISLGDGIALIYPVVSESSRSPVGALVIILAWPQHILERIRLFVAPFMRAIALIIILTALLGTVFGYWTARTLSQRLEKLERATREWEAGRFTIMVQDDTQDELGALARRLNEMAAQLQHLVHTREMVAMLEERHRLARELHDAVKQHLFSASMQLGVVQALLEIEPGRARGALHEAQRLLRHAQEELTALIHELRPLPLRDHPLPKAVQIYVAQWAEHTGCTTDVDVDEVPPLPLPHQIALFRLLQEALNNVERHSQAHSVKVHLASTPDGVLLSIEDDGVGFDVNEATAGVGLVSMHERVRALGGRLTIRSNPGHGTHIMAYVPYAQSAREAT